MDEPFVFFLGSPKEFRKYSEKKKGKGISWSDYFMEYAYRKDAHKIPKEYKPSIYDRVNSPDFIALGGDVKNFKDFSNEMVYGKKETKEQKKLKPGDVKNLIDFNRRLSKKGKKIYYRDKPFVALSGGFKKYEKDVENFVGEGKKISNSEFHRMNNGNDIFRDHSHRIGYRKRGNNGSNAPTKI